MAEQFIQELEGAKTHLESEFNALQLQITQDVRKEIQTSLEAEPQTDVRMKITRIQAMIQIISNMLRNWESFNEHTNIQLRLNQLKAMHELIKFLMKLGRRGYFRQPTGAGKTVLFGAIAKLSDVNTLILVPRTNLLRQTKKELVEVLGIPEADIGVVGGGKKEYGKKITVSTYQSHVSKMKGKKPDKKYQSQVRSCLLVVCDEAHRSLGKKTKDSVKVLQEQASPADEEGVPSEGEDEAPDGEEEDGDDDGVSKEEVGFQEEFLREASSLTSSSSVILDFTATTDLVGKSVLDESELIAVETYKNLIDSGVIVPYNIIKCRKKIRLDRAEVKGYMSEEDEEKLLRTKNFHRIIADRWLDKWEEHKARGEQYPTATYCRSIRACDDFVAAVHACVAERNRDRTPEHQLKCTLRIFTGAQAKTGKVSDDMLKDIEDGLMNGEIDNVVTVGKLVEGWNLPGIRAGVLARYFRSIAQIVQCAGRICRAAPGKDRADIFEVDWQLNAVTNGDHEKPSGDSGGPGGRKQTDPDHVNIADEEQPIELFYGIGARPVSLAEALHRLGEDIGSCCARDDGKAIDIPQDLTVDENGEVKISGKIAIHPEIFAATHPDIENIRYFADVLDSMMPIGKARCAGRPRPISIYWKSVFLARLTEHQSAFRVGSDQEVDIPYVSEAGGKESQSARRAVYLVRSPLVLGNPGMVARDKAISRYLDSKSIKPVKARVYGQSGQNIRAVYWKDQIDFDEINRMVKEEIASAGTFMKNGKAEIEIDSTMRTVYIIGAYAAEHGFEVDVFRRAADDRDVGKKLGLKEVKIPGCVFMEMDAGGGLKSKRVIDVYLEEDLKRLAAQIVRKNGLQEMEINVLAHPDDPKCTELAKKTVAIMELYTFAKHHNIAPQVLEDFLKKKKISSLEEDSFGQISMDYRKKPVRLYSRTGHMKVFPWSPELEQELRDKKIIKDAVVQDEEIQLTAEDRKREDQENKIRGS